LLRHDAGAPAGPNGGCADGLDNDADGYIDGADFDCQITVDP
jgi:hypothetical protein